MSWVYLVAIVVSTLGMGVLDWRYKLALWVDFRRTIVTVSIGVAVFIIWDIFGIALGIFFSGQSEFMTGVYLAPEFPIEELLFLTFLCYFTLTMYRILETRT